MHKFAQFLLLTASLVIFSAEMARCQDTGKTHSPSKSEKVNWRRNYREAREEAERRKMPLFLVFGDKTHTLQNPKVVALLNEQYVTFLVRLGDPEYNVSAPPDITFFPTTIIASHSGHILQTKIGFLNADDLVQLLLAKVPQTEPKKMSGPK